MLGLGFFALIAWEYHLGFAGGKFGGAELSEHPGLFWFFISIQGCLGFYFAFTALKGFVPRSAGKFRRLHAILLLIRTCAEGIFGLICVWALKDLVFMFVTIVFARQELTDRIVFALLACLLLGVAVFVPMQFLPPASEWRSRIHARWQAIKEGLSEE